MTKASESELKTLRAATSSRLWVGGSLTGRTTCAYGQASVDAGLIKAEDAFDKERPKHPIEFFIKIPEFYNKVYFLSLTNKQGDRVLWSNYRSQEFCVIDECDQVFTCQQLKALIQPGIAYVSTNVDKDPVELRATRFYLTAHDLPEKWWRGDAKVDKRDKQALIFHIRKSFQPVQCVSRVVDIELKHERVRACDVFKPDESDGV